SGMSGPSLRATRRKAMRASPDRKVTVTNHSTAHAAAFKIPNTNRVLPVGRAKYSESAAAPPIATTATFRSQTWFHSCDPSTRVSGKRERADRVGQAPWHADNRNGQRHPDRGRVFAQTPIDPRTHATEISAHSHWPRARHCGGR